MTALLAHKPVTASEAELAAAPPYRFWPPAARGRLAHLLAARPPDLFVSGHVHQSRELRADGTPPTFCEPDGIRQLTVTADFPDSCHGR